MVCTSSVHILFLTMSPIHDIGKVNRKIYKWVIKFSMKKKQKDATLSKIIFKNKCEINMFSLEVNKEL